MGGVRPVLIFRISYDFPVCTISASAWCSQSWISFFVMTCLTLIHKIIRVQADHWVIAIRIIQPYLMVNYSTRLIMAHFTQPAIYSQPCVDVRLPGLPPRWCLIELFLVQHDDLPALWNRKRTQPLGPDPHTSILTHFGVQYYALFNRSRCNNCNERTRLLYSIL